MFKKFLIVFELLLISGLVLFNLTFVENKISQASSSVEYEYVLPKKLGIEPSVTFGDLVKISLPTTPLPEETPIPPSATKSSYKIALIGDSMIETMGENLDYLDKALKQKYPNTEFHLYNYGIGSENVEMAATRIDQTGIATSNFDIIISGTWAYNPLVPFNQEAYKSKLDEITMQLAAGNSDYYMLIEIAPLDDGFGKGSGGVNWPDEISKPHVKDILTQLWTARYLAHERGYKIIDTYTPSRAFLSEYGELKYVNSHDGIHPSVEGHEFIANIIVSTIELH